MAWTPSVRDQRPSLFRDVTWSRFVFVYRHYEAAYQSRIQRSRSRKKFRGVTQWYRRSKRDLCLSSAQSARTLGTLHTLWISKLFLEIPSINYGQRGEKWTLILPHPTARKLPPLCMPSPLSLIVSCIPAIIPPLCFSFFLLCLLLVLPEGEVL